MKQRTYIQLYIDAMDYASKKYCKDKETVRWKQCFDSVLSASCTSEIINYLDNNK